MARDVSPPLSTWPEIGLLARREGSYLGSDYNLFDSSCPIVIDNGCFNFRIGWAGESDPRITFRNMVQRPRHKATGKLVLVCQIGRTPRDIESTDDEEEKEQPVGTQEYLCGILSREGGK
ncbi:hypothetical protein HHK36_019488 [Tetracentron sinense]|uniref:Uncharacterized protein n=1 Tax=Tetracentron sinense TaxID=13715 RepID=A0A834YWB9_TETSI|nr:hypothetical protein HHK36_019488 [Tetracentron sinense]